MPPRQRFPIPEYRPDVSDNLTQYSKNILNVVPQGDGYGPFPGASSGVPLANPCRGFFTARNSDGTLTAFRGTYNALYIDNGTGGYPNVSFQLGGISTVAIDNGGAGGANGTYTNVNIVGGSGSGAKATFTVSGNTVTAITVTTAGTNYKLSDANLTASPGGVTSLSFHVTALSGAATQAYNLGAGSNATLWQFAQFDNAVIAVAPGTNPQVYFLGTSTNFQDLGGGPPQASFVTVINRFVLLSGIAAQPNRIQWSDEDNVAQWTPGVGQADFQDIPDGGRALNVAGLDLYGIVLQDSVARLMFFVGPPVTFQITKITGGEGNGLYAPYAMALGQDRVFWLSPQGFKMVSPGSSPVPIGKEKVDRTFFNLAAANQQVGLIQATCDPKDNRFYCIFETTAAAGNGISDGGLLYDWALQRWAKLDFTGYNGGLQCIGTCGSLGAGLGQQANTMGLAGVGGNNGPLSFTQPIVAGQNIAAATLETGEHGDPSTRMFIRSFRPISDAPGVQGQISYRDTPLPPTFGTVASLSIAAAGSGGANATYNNVPLIGGSGTGLTANITVSGGAATAIAVNNAGTSDYSLTGVGYLSIGSAGSGGTPGTYTNVPIAGGSGFGLTATIVIGGGGAVSSVTVNNNGYGYTFADFVTNAQFTAPSVLIGNTVNSFFRIGASANKNLADITSLTANPALIGNVTGFVANVSTLNTYNYTAAQSAHPLTGEIPVAGGGIDARYARARITIPANQFWTYVMAIEPDFDPSSVY